MLTSSSNISEIAGIGPSYQKLLANLEIFTVGDLLNHLPARFEKFNTSKKISDLKPGEQVSFVGELFSIDNIRTRNGKRLTKGIIKDETGKIDATWFNQQYLSKALKFGVKYRFSGKVDIYGKKLNMIAPAFENYHEEDFELQNEGELIPIYPETKGISSKFISAKIKKALEEVNDEDFLPEEIIQKYKFLKFKDNYSQIHFPNNSIENPKLINESKKTIARILTEKRARQLASA
jgi:ATP-dependent DNA helicase RecG